MVCDYRLHKKQKNHIHLTVGGDKLIYMGDASASAAPLLETK